MANTIESKAKGSKAAQKLTKLCLRCGHSKDLQKDFYTNRDWDEQLGKDVWCKSCVGTCATKDNVKEYFWYNHREWSEKIWDIAMDKAKKALSVNATFQTASDQRQKIMLERMAAQNIPSTMPAFYKYVENGKDGVITYEDAKAKGRIDSETDDDLKVYSEFFNGYYTNKDLEYLENYYHKLEDDFTFDNESIRDYARKVCKASLQADKAQDDYRAGRCQFSDVKDALMQFDMLSKSANFAACRRKTGDASGLTSWAQTTLKLATTGHIIDRKIEWPKDDVDRVIDDLRHTARALGLDSI